MAACCLVGQPGCLNRFTKLSAGTQRPLPFWSISWRVGSFFASLPWHVTCSKAFHERMATKMNMLKLLQEVRGFAQFTSRPIEPKPTGPLLLGYRGLMRRKRVSRQKHFLKIEMKEPTDIPHPVPIVHLPTP
jgi:hypothetical protein